MTKPIKIIIENRDAIEAALRAVNGKATAHTYTSVYAMIRLAEEAEGELVVFGLPKNLRPGATYEKQSGGYLPNAYKNIAIATRVVIERRSSGWYLTGVQPASLFPRQNPRGYLTVTKKQADEAV